MPMYNVVVVEDETMLRRGLVIGTPWESFDCRVVGESANGVDGEALIRAVRPDIVVTDIRMAGQNGINMIARLKDANAPEFIIISGYAEFAYARKALEYGVCGYILKPVDEEEFRGAVLRAIASISARRCGDDHLPDLTPPTDYRERLLARARIVMEEHCNEPLTIADVASHLGVSASTLSHLFRERAGRTFLECLTRVRIHHAATLLAQEQLRVGEVAELVGYHDARHFCTLFKNEFGITPLQYRKGEMSRPRYAFKL